MRVAIYARVSTERQEKEHTIGSQLEALRVYAAKHGMEVVEEFADEGYSGARLDVCPIASYSHPGEWKGRARR